MRFCGRATDERRELTLPALVLVHGGQHAADCWEPTVDEIHRLAPDLTVLAVDLPGRRGKPGDLFTVTIADFVDSVVGDIEDAGLCEIILVGHSLAGLTVPAAATKLGSSRIREMILATVRPARRQVGSRYPDGTPSADRSAQRQEGRPE